MNRRQFMEFIGKIGASAVVFGVTKPDIKVRAPTVAKPDNLPDTGMYSHSIIMGTEHTHEITYGYAHDVSCGTACYPLLEEND